LTPEASIIIGTFNRAARLREALASLLCQRMTAGAFEIVIVNDGSTDQTQEICTKLAQEHAFVQVVCHSENLGLAAARNSGINAARGSCLLFIDDDCVAEPDWAVNLLSALRDHEIVAGCIRSPMSPFFLLCHNISEFHPFLPGQKGRTVPFIAGANFAMRRSVHEAVGKFSQSLRCAEDMEFFLRARERRIEGWFCPDAAVTHIPERKTLLSLLSYSAEHAQHTICLRQEFSKLLSTPAVMRSPLLLLLSAPFIALFVTLRIYDANPQLRRTFTTLPFIFAAKCAWCVGAAIGLRKYRLNEDRFSSFPAPSASLASSAVRFIKDNRRGR
jgi:glycosyltransferase involved in cell wall biosynthesis